MVSTIIKDLVQTKEPVGNMLISVKFLMCCTMKFERNKVMLSYGLFMVCYQLITYVTAYIFLFDNIVFDSSYEKTMVSNDQ